MSNKVILPKMPGDLAKPTTGKMWSQPSTEAFLAVSQLHKARQGGRKRKTLPGGGKLQPLFKNNAAPTRSSLSFGPKVLPNISSPITDPALLLRHVMSGDLRYLPDPSPSTVRIYLASNFSDMQWERDALLARAVPRLQETCANLGLHFQLVDLHWGVPEERMRTDLAMRSMRRREISECQRLSLGPNFIALLGDKYGESPIPEEIEESEFDILFDTAGKHDLNVGLMQKCYTKDKNCLSPSVYRLHGVTEDVNLDDLKDAIQKAVALACKEGKFTEAKKRKYFTSELEDEILHGIVQTKDPRRHCLCFKREFQKFKPHMKSTGVADFFDVITSENGEIKLNTDLYSSSLRMADTVNRHLGAGNFRSYFIEWTKDGMGSSNPDFQKYLNTLCQDFVREVSAMITDHAERYMSLYQNKEHETLQELLFHSNLCRNRSHNFQGQAKVFETVEKFLRDPRVNNKPFLLYGESGKGKSAIMATLLNKIKDWFTDDSVVVYRAMGTTSECLSIFKVVISITQQICLAYGINLPEINEDCCTLYKALFSFRTVLQEVSKSHAFVRPLYILLDGIHQLQPQEEALRGMWAMRDLPANVHIIVSTVPMLGKANLITGLIHLLSEPSCSLEVDDIEPNDAKKLVEAELQLAGRQLTKDQTSLIMENFEKCKQALWLRCTVDQALDWGSFLRRSEYGVAMSAMEYLSRVLDELEEQHGDLLIMSLAACITTAPVGIAERELIDVILGDLDIEEEKQRYPGSVVSNYRFLPPYVMASVKFHLRHFLEDHVVEGKRVLAWKHRLFYETVAQKYQVIFQGIDDEKITDHSTSYTLLLHENLLNMYLKENTKRSISFIEPEELKKGGIPLTFPQPVNKYNTMKLERVPVHLRIMSPVEGLSRTKEAVLFNFEWMLTKLRAKPFHLLTNDLLNILEISNHVAQKGEGIDGEDLMDLEILFEFLQLSRTALAKSSDNLPSEIIARLSPFAEKYQWIGRLLKQANEYIEAESRSMLVPLYPCFTQPQGQLRHTMQGPTHVLGQLQNGNTTVMFSQKYGVDIWLNSTGELLHRFPVNPEQRVEKVIAGSTNEFVLVGHYSHLKHNMDLSILSSETGVRLVHNVFPENFEAIALSESDSLLVVSTSVTEPPAADGSVKSQKCLLGVDVRTKTVVYTIPTNDIHEEGVTKLLFVPGADEKDTYLLTIGSKRSRDLGFWHLQRQCLEFKMLLNVFIEHVQVRGNIAVCGSARHGVLLFIDLNEGKLLKRIDESDLVDMAAMLVTKSGQHVVVATAEMGINVYSRENAAVSKVLGEGAENRKGRRLVPKALAMDVNEHFLFVGYESGDVIVYVVLTGQTAVRLVGPEAHTARVNSLLVGENYTLYSAADDNCAKAWNLAAMLSRFTDKLSGLDGVRQFSEEASELTVESLATQPAHPSEEDHVTDYVITPDQQQLITSDTSGPVTVWDLETGSRIRCIEEGCEGGVNRLYLACKGTLLIGHCADQKHNTAGRLQIWKLATGSTVAISSIRPDPILVYDSCVLPGDQKLLAVSPSLDNRYSGLSFQLIDLFELRVAATLQCSISGDMDRTNLRFIGATRHEMAPSAQVRRPAYTSTTASQLGKGARDSKTKGDTQAVFLAVLDYFPEASTSYFFTLRITGENFDEINMDRSDPMHVNSTRPGCTVLLPGARAVTGTVNGSICVWDTTEHKPLKNLYDQALYKETKAVSNRKRTEERIDRNGRPAHAGSVTILVASDNQQVLYSGATDGIIKVWHLESGELIHSLNIYKSQVSCLSASPDREVLVSGSSSEASAQLSVLASRHNDPRTACCLFTHAPVVRVSLAAQRVVMLTDGGTLLMARTVRV